MSRRLCAVGLSVLLSACSPRAPDGSRPIKIVSSLVRSGSASAQTSHIVHGIRMALGDAHWRAGPHALVYEDWDDASTKKADWDPEVEAANAARAVRDASVLVYLGPYNSGAAKVSAPILNRAGLASISPIVTYPGLTRPDTGELHEPGVYRPGGQVTFFRVVPPDDLQGAAGAAWMRQMGGKSVFVLDDLQLYGRGVADVFVERARAEGIRVVGRESIDARAQEYRSLVAKIGTHDPDWLYFGGTTQTNAGQLIKDAVGQGLRARIMLPDGCFEHAMIDAAGAHNAEGRVHLTFGGVPPEALQGEGADFVRRYRQAWQADPDVYAVYGYLAATAAIQALAGCQAPSRHCVATQLRTRPRFEGPLGPFRFDAHGDMDRRTMSGNVVRNGTFRFETLLEAR